MLAEVHPFTAAQACAVEGAAWLNMTRLPVVTPVESWTMTWTAWSRPGVSLTLRLKRCDFATEREAVGGREVNGYWEQDIQTVVLDAQADAAAPAAGAIGGPRACLVLGWRQARGDAVFHGAAAVVAYHGLWRPDEL